MKFKEIAENNLRKLKDSVYSGQGIICGRDESYEHFVQVLWITGRSPESRNRIFRQSDQEILIEPLGDISIPGKRKMIVYPAMIQKDDLFVVGNGSQTSTVMSYDEDNFPFSDAMLHCAYDYDGKSSIVPRVTGVFYRRAKSFLELSILKKSIFGLGCDRQIFRYEEFCPGTGFSLTSYEDDNIFTGEPYLLPLEGGIDSVATKIWDHLNPENRVALVTKFIDLSRNGETKVKIINAYTPS
jgi:hypothetical protein